MDYPTVLQAKTSNSASLEVIQIRSGSVALNPSHDLAKIPKHNHESRLSSSRENQPPIECFRTFRLEGNFGCVIHHRLISSPAQPHDTCSKSRTKATQSVDCDFPELISLVESRCYSTFRRPSTRAVTSPDRTQPRRVLYTV